MRTEAGVSLRRLPTWSDSRIFDPLLEFDVAATAGVRLAFRTRSPRITLRVRCDALQLEDFVFEPVVDLVVDHRFVARRRVENSGRVHFDHGRAPVTTRGPESVVTFDELGTGEKHVELWLPHTAACEVITLEASGSVTPPADDTRPVWIHHGSSISHCLEAPGPVDTWPVRSALQTNLHLIDLGFAGEALVDPFVARTIRETRADFISLKLGINVVVGHMMRERAFRAAVEGFLDTIREGHPTIPILVVSGISCRDLEENVAEGDLSLARSRGILSDVVEARAADTSLRYLDGRELLGPDEVGDLPDGLHPSPAAYLRMADRFSRLALAQFKPGRTASADAAS